ncbi:MAG: HAMP domain-containing protein [Comamonadaceae bacterium]|nr:MAG: HAMP domain-containing protein [Comamonadaceae bacterium]
MHFKKLRWPRSLRSRLLVVYALGMTLSALLVGTTVMLVATPFNRYMLQCGSTEFAEGLAGRIVFGPDGTPAGFDETKIERWVLTGFGDEVIVRIADADGRVVFAPAGEFTALAADGESFVARSQAFALTRKGVAMHAATAEVLHQGRRWYVQFAASDRLVLQMRESFGIPALHQGMLVIGITFLAVFLLATHITLQRMLKPLRIASQEAQRITPQTLDARVRTDGLPRELAPLVEAFNHALDRLQTGFRTQQEFLANAAHELKTPLALIRAQIELEPSDQRNPYLLQDVDRMARQVQQLLHLAEASEPRNYHPEPVDPQAAVAEVCGYMERVARQGGVHIVQQVQVQEAGQGWQADRGALFTLFKNLLENAIQHSPPEAVVTVAADAEGFTVADRGCGVAQADLGRLFDRFWRGASRRDEGAGLGLSICEEIARAHGWRIDAVPGADGVGLMMRVRFAA